MHHNSSERTGLARALSKLGYCSRTAARKLIADGRVRVDRRICRDPEKPVFLAKEKIEVDGQQVVSARKLYLMMNKPRGLVTTASDEKGRETVYSLLGNRGAWLGPVGRLDKASEGLLLFTNDSAWAGHITAPESHISKTYHVQIRGDADEHLLEQLRSGVRDSGEWLRAREARLLRKGEKNCWIEIVLDEGKNRHIRRMLAALEIEVLRLVRVSIGGLELGDLAQGSVRELTVAERKSLTPTFKSSRTAI